MDEFNFEKNIIRKGDTFISSTKWSAKNISASLLILFSATGSGIFLYNSTNSGKPINQFNNHGNIIIVAPINSNIENNEFILPEQQTKIVPQQSKKRKAGKK